MKYDLDYYGGSEILAQHDIVIRIAMHKCKRIKLVFELLALIVGAGLCAVYLFLNNIWTPVLLLPLAVLVAFVALSGMFEIKGKNSLKEFRENNSRASEDKELIRIVDAFLKRLNLAIEKIISLDGDAKKEIIAKFIENYSRFIWWRRDLLFKAPEMLQEWGAGFYEFIIGLVSPILEGEFEVDGKEIALTINAVVNKEIDFVNSERYDPDEKTD